NGGAYQPTPTFRRVTGGNYKVSVQDAVGCTVVNNVTIAQAEAPLTLDGDVTRIGCNNNITLTATGGLGSYLYSDNDGAWQASNTFPAAPAGKNRLLVQDAAGCIAD